MKLFIITHKSTITGITLSQQIYTKEQRAIDNIEGILANVQGAKNHTVLVNRAGNKDLYYFPNGSIEFNYSVITPRPGGFKVKTIDTDERVITLTRDRAITM